MNKIKSWSRLLILALFVCFFAGCGGGGSNSNDVAYSPNTPSWDTYDPRFDNNTPMPEPTVPNTEPEPTTPVQTDPTPTTEPTTPEPETTPDNTPVQPEPTPDTPASEPITPEPEPTPTPTPDPTPEPTPTPTPAPAPEATPTTDTYDIVSVLNGNWYGVSGSGTIMVGALGLLNPIDITLSKMTTNFAFTQFTENIGVLYITSMAYWDYIYNGNAYQILLYLDAEKFSMTFIDSNTWQLDSSDGTVVTIFFISETIAVIVQTGTIILDNETCNYSLTYTINKF